MSTAAQPAFRSAQFYCPKCDAPITYYDLDNSAYYACPDCRTYFQNQHTRPPKLFGEYAKGPDFVPQLLSLGATGTLPDGLTYRVIGYSARHEAKSAVYKWGEYLLFSPPASYAQLAVFEGHWLLIKPTEQPNNVLKANTVNAHVMDAGVRFDIYNRYSPRVPYAVGEFDWDLRADEKLDVAEFIAPPLMLIQEYSQSTKTTEWYRGEHLEPAQVAAAFGLDTEALPTREGVGAVQPAPGESYWRPLLNFTLFMALLVVAAQLFVGLMRPSQQLLADSYRTQHESTGTPAEQGAVIITPSFTVSGPAALEVSLSGDVDNNWMELPVALVNEGQGPSFEFTKALEYYHGYEDGGSWSEGSPSDEAMLSRVPSGRYHLNIYPISERGLSHLVSVRVTQNPALVSNTLLLVTLLFAYPVALYVWRYFHEQQRWQNSDYGPSNE
ncbi:DUF4178 domain-containing protein [Hymenobacter koreensis]|uniref:DUF4178 domain-containing protein n=1 Tax=Hymenobacter koreensis TaxID=1084523 RepID=A0ABP8IW11_9BACT